MLCETTAAPPRLSLADYTRPELIVPCLRETDPAGIIDELSHCLRRHGFVSDVLSFYHDAINHEFLSNSALPTGIAIPHARSPQINRLTMAMGRASEPVVWGLKASWQVEYVFLIAVPPTDALNYLPLLSSIAGFSQHRDLLAGLRSAADGRGIFDLLKGATVKSNDFIV